MTTPLRIWQPLLEPVTGRVSPEHRHRSRLLAALLLVVLPAGLLSLVVQLVTVPGFTPTFFTLLPAIGALLLAYFINHRGHYVAATWLVTVTAAVTCYGVILLNPADRAVFLYLLVPVTLATLLLPLRSATVLTALIVAGTFAAVALRTQGDPDEPLIAQLIALTLLAALMLISAQHRERLERLRRSQLAAANRDLEARVAERTAALRASEAHYRLMIETVPCGIDEIDFAGTVRFCNRARHTMLGYQPGELVGKKIWEIAADPEKARRTLPAYLRHIAGHQPPPGSLLTRNRRKDGTVLDVRVDWNYKRDAGGRVTGLVCVFTDITEQSRARRKLERSREQLRRMALRREADLESLRRRIAREVHDELGQSLTALNLDLHYLIRHYDRREAMLAKCREMQRLINDIIGAVQRISADLRPIILDDLGLEAACRWYIEQFQEKSGLACERFISTDLDRLPDRYAITLYRILQETLSNIARHARATRFTVELRKTAAAIALTVTDDGIGLSRERAQRGDAFGLVGIRERVKALRGRLRIHGGGTGTTVSVTLPLADDIV